MFKILIVDDDLEIIRSLGTTFTTLLKDYLVLTATTANAGLNFIKEQKPELIIMDVRLGPMSGMDLLEDYPKHFKDYRPHVIVVTAYPDERVKKRAEELKVDHFIEKPFSRETLLDAAFECIEKRLESHLRNVRFIRQSFQKKPERTTRTDQKIEERLEKEPDAPPEKGA